MCDRGLGASFLPAIQGKCSSWWTGRRCCQRQTCSQSCWTQMTSRRWSPQLQLLWMAPASSSKQILSWCAVSLATLSIDRWCNAPGLAPVFLHSILLYFRWHLPLETGPAGSFHLASSGLRFSCCSSLGMPIVLCKCPECGSDM